MNYNDKESKQFEEKYEQWVKALGNLTPEKMAKINEAITELEKLVSNLKNKPDKTEEDLKFMQSIKSRMKEIAERMTDAQLILGEKLFRNSMKFYEHFKKLSAEGNKEAQQAFEKLDANYKKMLESQINKN